MNSNGASGDMVTDEMIMNRIYVLRGQKVMIDADLASLYQMGTGKIRTLATRHADRFPKDFMFELRLEDYYSLKQQDSTVKRGSAARRLPVAFTEQGLAMLAGLLKTERSISINVRIIRIFTLIRQLLPDYPELSRMMEQLRNNISCPK